MRAAISLSLLSFLGQCFAETPDNYKQHERWSPLVWVLFFGIIILLSIISVLVWKLYKLKKALKSKKPRSSKNERELVKLESGPGEDEEAVPDEPWCHKSKLPEINGSFRIDENNLRILEMIEERRHFTLHKGRLRTVGSGKQTKKWKVVMIKKANNPNDRMQKTLIHLELAHLCDCKNHPNLLALAGFTGENGNYTIITEYPEGGTLLDHIRPFNENGKFKNYLTSSGYSKTHSSKSKKTLGSLSTRDLLSFAWQIINGMKEMAAHPHFHRQLSLCNIYLTANKTIRIGNFSLTRTNGNGEYYRKNTEWEMLGSHRAPETTTEERFTQQSDVWSLAVCLFELFSLGEEPYKNVKNIFKFVKDGERLERPKYCHPEIYDLMKKCWDLDEFKRPVFEKCLEELELHFAKYDMQILGEVNSQLQAVAKDQSTFGHMPSMPGMNFIPDEVYDDGLPTL